VGTGGYKERSLVRKKCFVYKFAGGPCYRGFVGIEGNGMVVLASRLLLTGVVRYLVEEEDEIIRCQ
jgi:hypothetical protein